MEVENFEDARRLDRESLTKLLASERPEQRLWAIWALAISLGEKAGGFAHRIDREPDPGVRRSLAVILASHGEHDLLIELARHDRSQIVRESVIALITRIAVGSSGPREAKLRAIVEDAAASEPAIQIAMLGAIAKGAPEYLVAIAIRMLDSVDREVQLEAFETLLRLDTPRTYDRARLWFRSQHDLWNYVERWLRAADLASLAEATHDLPMHIRGNILAKLRSPPWPIVEQLLGNDLELLRAMLQRTDIAIPATLLARTIMRGVHVGFTERLTTQLAIAGNGRALLAELRRAIADDDPTTAANVLAERVRRYADAIEISDRGELFAELADAHPVEHLLGLENAVARWVDERDAPADLLPMLGPLSQYCTKQLEVMKSLGVRGRRRQRQLADPTGTSRPDPQAVFSELSDLIEALERVRPQGA